MDAAVELVQAYLQVNGYFTVVEYPVLELADRGGGRTATDLDVLAFRFPGAGAPVHQPGRSGVGPTLRRADPALGGAPDQADMIVGEVKQGRTRVNPAMRDPLVLAAALSRFGCCPEGHAADALVSSLLKRGRARTHAGHMVRLVAFGSGGVVPRAHCIDLQHIIGFLDDYLVTHWDTVGRAQLSQPALALLALFRKAGCRVLPL